MRECTRAREENARERPTLNVFGGPFKKVPKVPLFLYSTVSPLVSTLSHCETKRRLRGRESTDGANDSSMHHVFKDRHQSAKSFNCFQGSLRVPSSFFFPFFCSLSLFSSPPFLITRLLRYARAKLLFNPAGTSSCSIAIKDERIGLSIDSRKIDSRKSHLHFVRVPREE